MNSSHPARALTVVWGLLILGAAAHADQVLNVGILVSAKNISFDGRNVKLNGDVKIAATPDRGLTLQAQKDGLLVKFSENQSRTVTVTPFDVKSERLTVTPGGFVLVDKNGNTLNVFSSGVLPGVTNAPTVPIPARTPPPATPAASNAPVTVTIVQTPPPPAQTQPAPEKNERYVDPVTDRGAVIP